MNERNSYASAVAEPLEHVAVELPEGSGPNIYALQMQGDCMEPDYQDGGTVICDPDAEPVAGDVVAVWFRDGKTPPSLKRLVLGVPPAAMWEGSPDFDAASRLSKSTLIRGCQYRQRTSRQFTKSSGPPEPRTYAHTRAIEARSLSRGPGLFVIGC